MIWKNNSSCSRKRLMTRTTSFSKSRRNLRSRVGKSPAIWRSSMTWSSNWKAKNSSCRWVVPSFSFDSVSMSCVYSTVAFLSVCSSASICGDQHTCCISSLCCSTKVVSVRPYLPVRRKDWILRDSPEKRSVNRFAENFCSWTHTGEVWKIT